MCQYCGGNEGWIVPLIICLLAAMVGWFRKILFLKKLDRTLDKKEPRQSGIWFEICGLCGMAREYFRENRERRKAGHENEAKDLEPAHWFRGDPTSQVPRKRVGKTAQKV